MTQLLTWVKNVQLTAQQWLALSVAAIIGVLYTTLAIRTRQLHAVRVSLLKGQFDQQLAKVQQSEDQDYAATNRAKAAYEDALNDYRTAVGASYFDHYGPKP